MFLQDKKSVIGDGTFSSRLIMPCLRKSRPRQVFTLYDAKADHLISFQDYERARQVYCTALNLVPHKQFTFAKLWIMAAQFEIRRLDLAAVRKILGTAIGMCPKEALFKGYIRVEMDVRPWTIYHF